MSSTRPVAVSDDRTPAEPGGGATRAVRRKAPLGAVALVAAGPGDPELLTIRAVALLAAAELVVADAEVVDLARTRVAADVEVVSAVALDGSPLSRAERAKLVIEASRAGRSVVRFLAGDPVLDGAVAAEAALLAKARVPFELAPGVSTVTGIAAYAGITLTGGAGREVRVLDADDPGVDYALHMSPRVTLVILGGADRAPEIAKALLAAGRSAQTPVAITRGGTTVEQVTVTASLADVATVVKASRQQGEGIIVIGDPVGARDRLSWFETKPLFGWRVLVPRTKEQAGALSEQLRRHGAVPIEVPTISVEPPRTPQQMERAIHGLVSGRYEWIAFTSANAVKAVRERFDEYGLDARSFAGLRVAAVGEATAAALVAFGVKPDLVPSGDQSSVGLLEDWPEFDSLVDPINRVFLPRADIATETLVAGLTELGWEVDDVTAYRTVRAAPPPAETREAIKTGGFDAVLFTSSSTVRNLVGIAGKPHPTTVVACIGKATVKTAEEHGLRVDVMPEDASVAALADALAAHGEVLRLAAAEAGEASWRPSRRRPAARRKAT